MVMSTRESVNTPADNLRIRREFVKNGLAVVVGVGAMIFGGLALEEYVEESRKNREQINLLEEKNAVLEDLAEDGVQHHGVELLEDGTVIVNVAAEACTTTDVMAGEYSLDNEGNWAISLNQYDSQGNLLDDAEANSAPELQAIIGDICVQNS